MTEPVSLSATNGATPTQAEHLRWALMALDLVNNGLKNRRNLVDEDVELSNLRAAKFSIEKALASVPSETVQKGWRCQAEPTGVVPTDCDWPNCGCDPHVDRVIRGLQESGWTVERTPSAIEPKPEEDPGRATVGVDGSHGFALLGADLQSGEAEFSPIEGWPQATYKQERAAWGRALRALEDRLGTGPLRYEVVL